MSRHVLIDGIIRQVIVTLAELATSGGVRTPLAHVGNEVFLGLAKELEAQGLGRKVIADMFGMTLRAYYAKVRRLSESQSVRGQTLWTAVLDYISQHKTRTRAEIEKRFAWDDVVSVSGVLHDLVRSQLLFRSGEGSEAVYRVTTPEDVGEGAKNTVLDHFVWAEIFRSRPCSLQTLLGQLSAVKQDDLQASLERLKTEGKIRSLTQDDEEFFTCEQLIIPVGSADGWEASVLDHFQAMTLAIVKRAQQTTKGMSIVPGSTGSTGPVGSGGSTYHFELSADHPLRHEVHALLSTLRQQVTDLRKRVDEETARLNLQPTQRISFYMGQVLVADEPEEK